MEKFREEPEIIKPNETNPPRIETQSTALTTPDLENNEDDIELLNIRKRLGIEAERSNLHEIFIDTKDSLQRRLEGSKKALETTQERLQITKQDTSSSNARIKSIETTLEQKQEAIKRIEKIQEFLREPQEEDILYRKEIESDWSNEILKSIPKNLPLRFHGCPIYVARDILSTGEISSSVDRLGYESSWDTEGQVSVTTPETVSTTVNGYSDLHAENYCLPAGCIFAMLPKDEQDAKAGESMIMGNINLETEPERLFSIITTPENLDRVKDWAKILNVDENKIVDFKSFLNKFETLT